MKLIINNINNTSYPIKHQNNKKDVLADKNPQNHENNGVSFGAGLPFKFSNKIIQLTQDNVDEINKILGDNFFTEQLAKAGWTDKLEFKTPTFLSDLLSTIKYPFYDMWLDIASFVAKKAGKTPKADGILAKYSDKVNKENSKQLVLDIVSKFSENSEDFVDNVAKNISNATRNYRSRDERTLNRMLTSTVSAIYSANDFYNISMLQKDDKNEAKKAEKGRFKQEISRMLLSGGLTFVTMGALNKHIKNSMFLSAASIAISALISEIGSRLISHTPLLPLTPKQAKEYAQKNSNKQTSGTETKNNQTNNTQTNTTKQKQISFKSNSYENIFKDFAQKDGTFSPLNMFGNTDVNNINKHEKNNCTKKMNAATIALSAVAVACLMDLFAHKTKPGKAILKAWETIRDKITTKTEVIDGKKLDEYKEVIGRLKNDEQISSIMSKYSSMLDEKSKLEIKSDRFLVKGIYNGVTKIFKTIYDILSSPVNFKKYFNNTRNIEKENNKALVKLYSLYKKSIDNTGKLDEVKFIEEIKKRTRNFEQGIETGDLANFSRTLVTAITSYFFINDYRNKVLIESEGKDIDGARAETKQRLSHKLSNFIINGTIMNLGNSIFKVPLNNSLIAAGLIAIGEETTNEALVRKSICQPIGKKHSRQEILDFEEQQMNKKGILGAWSRLFRKITGKKTLTEKAGIDTKTKDKK